MEAHPLAKKTSKIKVAAMHYIHILILSFLLISLPAQLYAAETDKLTIFYTNDVHGETEPCG